jgi:TrpR-related protein YerC/YecD
MKANRPTNLRQEQQHERALCAAIMALANVEECRSFFRDLCTPAELQAMADRWAVVELLDRGLPYREIHRQTGVSVTTIGRVARYLTSGNGGYRAVTLRLMAPGGAGARTAPTRAAAAGRTAAPRMPAARGA